MIHRYPSIFQLFTIPSVVQDHLCVGLTPLAALLASQELSLKSSISINLAIKLQKLLMISPHRRLLLSKLVHLAPDFGLPSNFRSRLCNEYPDRFKTVDTSYGRALELVSWDPNLAVPLPPIDVVRSPDLIVDRPLKFKHLRLRKGLNLKRRHRDFLIKYGELPEVSPYCIEEFEFSEKRACAVVRELLWMTLEKRTLVDHLTHFRKDFGLSNKLRGMIVRHPELFYVSMKGQRDSVFLVEGYDDKGGLLEKDELLSAKERYELVVLMKLFSVRSTIEDFVDENWSKVIHDESPERSKNEHIIDPLLTESPYEGQHFDTVEDARLYYERYGRGQGISTKIHNSTKRSRSDDIGRAQ
ncbi:hypothetical protein GIB67_010078 [Kingdonia uniflora]|uniref:PORR domain-containing protein n=1 Tax=Kingdonia uniflora TaxID=39325 RepID=A0A7J7PAH6_9MAGN|nr:hypothetical protein GIB67_010078 [Kingdonia uniflora]